ncbi:MAG: PAS domain S-box protein [Microscillaceae bacterium]|nr:PAS domain S-box protein [Microscillaceae bacterium]
MHKQLEVEKANAELAANVHLKTLDLQEALEASRATEEELRQNMEELQATQDEMENQRQQLLENQHRMEQVEKELRERQANMERNQWLESNLSHFDDIMRLKYDQPLDEFSEAIIQHLAELIQATQGAFYIYDEEQQSLVMSGGYACTPASVKQKAFKLGEGMLGQVIKTKRTMHIEALSSESVVVESALTRIQSRHLLIMPLLYNEDLQGVIEIALLHPLDALHQDFIQRLSKNLAAMLQSIRGILRTQKLLTQSQEITAQLRENTRELEKTKREVEQKAIEFQTQFQAIDRSMLVLEYYQDGKIRSANDNFRQLVQFESEELTGKHLSVFLTEAFLQSEEYQNLWPRLFKENYAQAEYAGQTKNGQAFWLRANHYGLKGADPQSDRIMVLAYDITREKEQARKIKEQLRTLAEKEEMMRRNLDIMKELQAEVQHKAAELQAQLQVINLSTAMIEYDNLGYIRYANDKFSQITGYASRELVGQSNKILLDPKFAKSKSYDKLWARLRAKEFVEGEFEFVSKSGHSLWLRGSYYPVLDKNGQVAKVMQLATDISHEMRQEEQIKAHLMDLEITKTQLQDAALALESELQALGSHLGWLVLDAQGKIVKVSQKINEGYLLPLSLAEGMDFKALLARKAAQTKDYQQFWTSLETQKPAEAQWLSPLLGKEAETFAEHYLPIANEQGQLQKVIALFLPFSKNGQSRSLRTRKIESNEAR